jgi:hypothetical protein
VGMLMLSKNGIVRGSEWLSKVVQGK